MAIAFVQKSFQAFGADGRDRDALRAPGIAVGSGQYLKYLEELVGIIQWLTHSHKKQISQFLVFRQGLDLVQDFVGRQVLGESLFSRHAKEAIHFASDLRGDAKRGPVVGWDINRFHKVSRSGRIEVFDGSVY